MIQCSAGEISTLICQFGSCNHAAICNPAITEPWLK